LLQCYDCVRHEFAAPRSGSDVAQVKFTRPAQIVLVDPPGSGLFNAVTRGVAFAAAEAEGRRLRHPCDTITEGIGINRLTANFRLAQARARGLPLGACPRCLQPALAACL